MHALGAHDAVTEAQGDSPKMDESETRTVGSDETPEPRTEAGAANDATEIVDDDVSASLRRAAGAQAWSEEGLAVDDTAAAELPAVHADAPASQPWSAVTGQAAALVSVGAAVAALIAVLGWFLLHKDRPGPQAETGQSTSTVTALAPPPAPVAVPLPPVTVTVAPPAPSRPALTGVDAKFIVFLRNNGPSTFSDISDTAAIANAHLICKDMLQGAPTRDIAARMPSISPNDFAWFLDTSTAYFCPQIGGNS
jgi:hypothetical protein